MAAPYYFDVHWYGPYSVDDASKLNDPNLVLYMICGTHGLYGKGVPLYIGKTLRTVATRVKEHTWGVNEADPVNVYAAAISQRFSEWSELEGVEEYPPPENSVVERIEALLIYAHQPVYNSRSKMAYARCNESLVVFNTGRRSTLWPEVSTMYWYQLGE